MSHGTPPRGGSIRVGGLTKSFGRTRAVDDVSLSVEAGEFFCLLGPSGCGKSTLLRLLAGFETADSGAIELDGRDIAGTPPHRRPLNIMVQSYALFPHLSVAGNIGYGLRREGRGRAEIAERVDVMLRLVQLEGYGPRSPSELSGGQRQRVALARALAKRPRVLLLDEPLGALDRKLRVATQRELKALQANLGTTFIMVTHDGEEAMLLADRLAVMERGRIVQLGSPRDLYERPLTRFVAEALGDVNLIEAVVGSCDGQACRLSAAAFAAGITVALRGPERLVPGQAVAVAVRPERLRLASAARSGPAANTAPARVTGENHLGPSVQTTLAASDGSVLRVRRAAGELCPTVGSQVQVGFEPEAGVVLPR